MARLTKRQHWVLISGWVLVLASTLAPPMKMASEDIGKTSMGFRPIWELFGSDTGLTVMGMWTVELNWSVLVLVWAWIGLSVTAGLWVFRERRVDEFDWG